MRRWVGRILVLVLGVAGFFAVLFLLGHWADVGVLRNQERYLVAVADIACPTPPGLEKADFLEQVRYYSHAQPANRLPERFSILEDGLEAKLTRAFAAHPWVEKVEQVALQPPRAVEVKLTFRTPVLAVTVAGQTRAVDGHGILLPKSAPTADLPLYAGRAAPPRGGEGSPWGDPKVEQRARELAKEPRTK